MKKHNNNIVELNQTEIFLDNNGSDHNSESESSSVAASNPEANNPVQAPRIAALNNNLVNGFSLLGVVSLASTGALALYFGATGADLVTKLTLFPIGAAASVAALRLGSQTFGRLIRPTNQNADNQAAREENDDIENTRQPEQQQIQEANAQTSKNIESGSPSNSTRITSSETLSRGKETEVGR
jgi:hypothetical protein